MRFIPIFIILIFFSCKKDIEPPVVGQLTLNQSPDTLFINIDTNDKVMIECMIEDNVDLTQLRIFSANLITGTPSDSSLFQNFVYSINRSIDSNPYLLSDSLNIGNNSCTGIYSINLSAIDSEANEGHGEDYVIWIFSSEAPSTNITAPDFGSTSYNAGDTIFFQGTANDNVAIKNIYFNLYNAEGINIASNQFNYSDTVFTSWDYLNNDAQLIIPSDMETGKHLTRIRIVDNDGNLTMIQDSITVN